MKAKKILAILMCIMLAGCLLPVNVTAAESETYSVTVVGGTADKSVAAAGDTVTITADDPDEGWAFVQWSLNDGIDFDQTDGFTTTFTMPAREVTVHAVFREIVITKELYDEVYTGDPYTPTFGLFGVTLEGVDAIFPNSYAITYEDNVDAGTAKVTVTLTDNRVGHKTVTFQILPADISTATVDVEDDQMYDGTELTPEPTVTWNGKSVNSSDYTLSYENNVLTGTATVTVTGTHNFKDTTSTSGTFNIVQRPLTVKVTDQEYMYNGQPQGEGDTAYEDPAEIAEKITVEGLADGDAVTSIILDGAETEPGEYEGRIEASSCTIGERTSCYDISYTPGTLTILQRKATITVNDASKAFGGTDPEFTGTVEGLISENDLGEISYTRTNDAEDPGTYKGVITAEYTANPYYDVTVVNGDFTIEKAPQKEGTLTFDLAGGTLDGKTGIITVKANVGEVISIPAAPVREGYTFKYWKGSEYHPGDKYTVEGDHAFTAVWEKEAEKSSDSGSKSPKTGDESHIGLWSVLLGASMLGLIMIILLRKKARR